MDVGGLTPIVRSRFRSTSRTIASTTTSGLLLSISLRIFSAMATLSGVSRMMIALVAVICVMYLMLRIVRSAVIASVISVADTLFDRYMVLRMCCSYSRRFVGLSGDTRIVFLLIGCQNELVCSE